MSDHGVVRYLFPCFWRHSRSRAAAATSIPRPLRRVAPRSNTSKVSTTGDFGEAYATLHPAYKKIVSRSQFSDCAASTIPVGQLDSIEVLDVFDDPVQIPDAGEQEAKAVRVRITSTAGKAITFVNHEVNVADRWNWVLSDSAVRAYQAGRCPGARSFRGAGPLVPSAG